MTAKLSADNSAKHRNTMHGIYVSLKLFLYPGIVLILELVDNIMDPTKESNSLPTIISRDEAEMKLSLTNQSIRFITQSRVKRRK